jgi:hypothetical protein
MRHLAFAPRGKSKYRNQRVEMDGMTFASKREAARYAELRLLERIGDIHELECQPRFPLVVNGHRVATYVADFRYRQRDGTVVVEDVKSEPTKTPVYRLKAKLVAALHGVVISEVQ